MDLGSYLRGWLTKFFQRWEGELVSYISCCTVSWKLSGVYADGWSMSHLETWRGLMYGVATIYDVALQRLYVCRRVRWMTFGDVVQRSLFHVSTRKNLARSPLVLISYQNYGLTSSCLWKFPCISVCISDFPLCAIQSVPKKCIHSLLINIFGINLNEISISGWECNISAPAKSACASCWAKIIRAPMPSVEKRLYYTLILK
jgi:hypothetical protein